MSRAALTRLTITAALLTSSGCLDGGAPATITSLHRSGAYRITYVAPDGAITEDAYDDGLFNSPSTSPRGHVAVWRRSETTLEIVVGNVFPEVPIPVDGACPNAVEARLFLGDVVEPERIATHAIDATNARLFVSTEAPTTGACARTTSMGDSHAITREVVPTGHVTLDGTRCLNEPLDWPCAMAGSVAWSFRGDDGAGTFVVESSGVMHADDSVRTY